LEDFGWMRPRLVNHRPCGLESEARGVGIGRPHEQAARSRQIAAAEREIDQLVYEPYVLTDNEIRIAKEVTA
jgi:hypothetical protein